MQQIVSLKAKQMMLCGGSDATIISIGLEEYDKLFQEEEDVEVNLTTMIYNCRMII